MSSQRHEEAIELQGGEAEVEAIESVLLRAVRRHCPRYLQAEVEDLVQSAMLKVLATWRSQDGRSRPPSSYLWRVAHSVVIDEIRLRQRRLEESLEDRSEQELKSKRPGPERTVSSRRVGDLMTACLRELTPHRRRAAILRLQGHRVAEIAKLFEWKAKRAENTVYRALADLRACLRKKGVEL